MRTCRRRLFDFFRLFRNVSLCVEILSVLMLHALLLVFSIVHSSEMLPWSCGDASSYDVFNRVLLLLSITRCFDIEPWFTNYSCGVVNDDWMLPNLVSWLPQLSIAFACPNIAFVYACRPCDVGWLLCRLVGCVDAPPCMCMCFCVDIAWSSYRLRCRAVELSFHLLTLSWILHSWLSWAACSSFCENRHFLVIHGFLRLPTTFFGKEKGFDMVFSARRQRHFLVIHGRAVSWVPTLLPGLLFSVGMNYSVARHLLKSSKSPN